MVKTYCVKQKKQTDCVPGSELYVKTKNNRMMLKCLCLECGIVKSLFISEKSAKSGQGIGQKVNSSISAKIPGFGPAQTMASILLGATGGDKKIFDKFWRGDFAKGMFNKKSGIQTSNFWKPASAYKHERHDPSCNYVEKRGGKWVNHYCD